MIIDICKETGRMRATPKLDQEKVITGIPQILKDLCPKSMDLDGDILTVIGSSGLFGFGTVTKRYVIHLLDDQYIEIEEEHNGEQKATTSVN